MPSVSAAEAEAYRQAQAGVRALVERDLLKFWSHLDLSRPDRVATAIKAYVPLLVRRYGSDAGALAAEWYDEQRALAGIGGRFRAETFASPYEDAVDGMVRRAVGGVFTDNPGATLTALTGSVGKYVLAASRATIARNVDRDPRAAGWQRVARASACGFCRMLEGRGGVYRRETVHFAAHGDCNCASVPSWDQSAPEVDVRLYEASARTTRMTPEQRERHNALVQRAIDQYT